MLRMPMKIIFERVRGVGDTAKAERRASEAACPLAYRLALVSRLGSSVNLQQISQSGLRRLQRLAFRSESRQLRLPSAASFTALFL